MSKPRKLQNRTRDILFVTREYDGLAGAGGVKDVCRQLAETLAASPGHRVRVILPCYGFMNPSALGFSPLPLPASPLLPADKQSAFTVDMNYTHEERRETLSIWQGERNGVTIWLVEAERFAEKLGVYTYTAQEQRQAKWKQPGAGHVDYFAMNILLQKAALDLLLLLDEQPDIIHCHDGHAATLAALIRELPGYRHFFRATGLIVTVHNAGTGYHQEIGDLPFARAITGLPDRVIQASLLAGHFDPFVAAAPYAQLNAVSENYARELQESDEDARTGWLGHLLLERGIRLAGITNGIDPASFNPKEPQSLGLAAAFSPQEGDLHGKQLCKEDLLAAVSTPRANRFVEQIGSLRHLPDLPLLTFIGRLTAQKGVDILIQALNNLLDLDAHFQILLLGNGDQHLEKQLTALALAPAYRGRVCFLRGFDPVLANKVYAAGDFFLIPSLYEPCGLTDYIAQLLGNLPIVRAVGGLVKVLDGQSGFRYLEHEPEALTEAIQRALHLFRTNPLAIQAMQREAVTRILAEHTWDKVMKQYLALYGTARHMTLHTMP